MKKANLEILGELCKQKLKSIKSLEQQLKKVNHDERFKAIYTDLIYVLNADLILITTVIDSEKIE